VERQAGQAAFHADVSALLGLYDYLGLPADVIYLLVCHCAERLQRRFGEGPPPTHAPDRKRGLRLGADGHRFPGGGRGVSEKVRRPAGGAARSTCGCCSWATGPAPSEEKYLAVWQEMGFPPEAVALAYDKTMLKCHELKWNYLNGILKRWNDSGLHTPAEIQTGDRPAAKKTFAPEPARDEAPDRMREYAQNLRKERGD
jgi:DnaD/phage-associated family protein